MIDIARPTGSGRYSMGNPNEALGGKLKIHGFALFGPEDAAVGDTLEAVQALADELRASIDKKGMAIPTAFGFGIHMDKVGADYCQQPNL